MKRIVRPTFQIATPESPKVFTVKTFPQGFAIEFPGRQEYGILDRGSDLGVRYDDDFLVTCVEVLVTMERMKKGEFDNYSPVVSCDNSLQITNSRLCDMLFRSRILLDERQNLLEIRCSKKKLKPALVTLT